MHPPTSEVQGKRKFARGNRVNLHRAWRPSFSRESSFATRIYRYPSAFPFYIVVLVLLLIAWHVRFDIRPYKRVNPVALKLMVGEGFFGSLAHLLLTLTDCESSWKIYCNDFICLFRCTGRLGVNELSTKVKFVMKR